MKNNSPIKLAVCGSSGRMGLRISALALKDARFQLVAGVEREATPTARFISGTTVPIVFNVAEVLPKSDAVIDFTSPDGVLRTATAVAKAKKALVIGTTGLKPAALNSLRKISKKIPIVISPNMSVGVNVLFELVKKAAATLAHYDIEIVEAHHNLKKDAPSGTALRLAEVAAQASKRSEKDFVFGRGGLVGARKSKEIGVLAVRAGDIVGDHTVLIGGPGERLELTHRAHSRDAFASGALEAAAWAVRQRAGLYSMADVLGWKK
jgi:4-hydroxy-tetrahydrodipicolinate reductase